MGGVLNVHLFILLIDAVIFVLYRVRARVLIHNLIHMLINWKVLGLVNIVLSMCHLSNKLK